MRLVETGQAQRVIHCKQSKQRTSLSIELMLHYTSCSIKLIWSDLSISKEPTTNQHRQKSRDQKFALIHALKKGFGIQTLQKGQDGFIFRDLFIRIREVQWL